MPLLLAYVPFLSGDRVDAIGTFAFGTFGLIALAGALEGYLEAPVSWWLRIVLVALGAGLLWQAGWLVDAGVLALPLVVIVLNVRMHRRSS